MSDRNAAADRVVATLARDPELLDLVRNRLASPTVLTADDLPRTPLDEALALLAEGTAAFQDFCVTNEIRRGVFGASTDPAVQRRNPLAKHWKKFMKENAIPRNVKVAKMLVAYFEGHLPQRIKEFCDYVDDYRDLITDWDNEVPDAQMTIGRNFPTGFDDYLQTLKDEHDRLALAAAKKVLEGPHMAWSVLMIEHEFGQRDEGWALFMSREDAEAYRVEQSKGSHGAPGQYFEYGTPVPQTVEHGVWLRLVVERQLQSKNNPRPRKGAVITLEQIR